MKKALSILAAFAFAGSAFAQGKITLSNSDLPNPTGGGTYNAVIDLDPALGMGQFPGGNFTAGLFREGTLTPIGATANFFNLTGPDAQFNWMFENNPEITVAGVNPGSTANFFVGAWLTSQGSYATALTRGQSAVFTSRALGGPNPVVGELPITTPPTTFQGFTISQVPEPTSMALGLIGLGALALRRRK